MSQVHVAKPTDHLTSVSWACYINLAHSFPAKR